MNPIRIGTVEYLNTAPLIEGVAKAANATLVPAVPSRLIDLLIRGEVDLALVSVVDLARSSTPLVVLPVGMIGCDGPTLTVRLFSDQPIDRIARVHADTDSHTSVALAKVLLKRVYGITPEFVDYDARERAPGTGVQGHTPEEAWPPAVLLIGDKVVSDSPPAVRYPHQLDLGQAWHALTGLPFVYAVWACLEQRAADPDVRAAAAVLDRARRRNGMRLDAIAAKEAGSHGWPGDLAREYLGSRLRYEFTARAADAVRIFFGMAAEDGLLPPLEPKVAEIGDFVPTPG